MKNDLSHLMQDRLDKWRKNTLAIKTNVPRGTLKKTKPVHRDYGDDISDYQKKSDEEWSQQLQNDKIFRGYL